MESRQQTVFRVVGLPGLWMAHAPSFVFPEFEAAEAVQGHRVAVDQRLGSDLKDGVQSLAGLLLR
jgi:hypothetical protein